MKHSFLIKILFLIFLFQSCSETVTEADLIGKYCNPNEASFEDYKRLTLEKNNLYIYKGYGVDGRLFNCGSWEIINNSIVLDSGNSLTVMNAIDMKHEQISSDSIIFTFNEAFFNHPKLQNLIIDFDGIRYEAKQRTAIAKADLIKKAKEQNIHLTTAEIYNNKFYTLTFGSIEDNEINISLKENMSLKEDKWIFAKYKIRDGCLNHYYPSDVYLSNHKLVKCTD